MNIQLIDYYFDDQVPSLFTCLFNQNPCDYEAQLTQRLDSCTHLITPVSIERLVLLDKYYQAKHQDSIVEECKSIASSLCERVFSPQHVHANEVRMSFLSYVVSVLRLLTRSVSLGASRSLSE